MSSAVMDLEDLGVDPGRLTDVCARYGVAELDVFGSVARGDATSDSDIDLLYVLAPGHSLGFAINRLEDELSVLFGRPVDLVSKSGVHPLLQQRVLDDARELYARDRLLLTEMADAARRIVVLVASLDRAERASDRTRVDALLRNFTVLGEAASQVSADLKAGQDEIVWSDPVRMRNRVVHGYWSVELDVLVATAREDLPALVGQLEAVLAELCDEPGGS